MNHRSTIITIGKRRPVMTPSIHRELVRTYWNHRQLVKRYQAGQLTEDDRRIGCRPPFRRDATVTGHVGNRPQHYLH